MIPFPTSTSIGKRIPKELFYQNLTLTPELKRAFVEDVESIVWLYMLSPATLNVTAGKSIQQIDVVQVNLKRLDYHAALLEIIEKTIPRPLVFILKHQYQYQLLIHYKECTTQNSWKIIETYQTSWMSESDFSLEIKGISLDLVYEQFVLQIAGNTLFKKEGTSLKETVIKTQEAVRIQKKMAELEKKMRNEKQFNIQLKIASEIKSLKREQEIRE